MDFMHDSLCCGRSFRTLNILDEGIREAVAIEVDTSLPSGRVIRVLEQLSQWRHLPRQLRVDNGPEMISNSLISWCREHNIELVHIQPGKPTQNAFHRRPMDDLRSISMGQHMVEFGKLRLRPPTLF